MRLILAPSSAPTVDEGALAPALDSERHDDASSEPPITARTRGARELVAVGAVAAQARRVSYVRIKSKEDDEPTLDPERADLDRFITMLRDDDRRLSMLLAVLGNSLEAVPHDPSARAAATAVARRVADVACVRDALRVVLDAADHIELAPLYAPDAPLGPFLKGVTVWCDGALEALAVLEGELRRLSPDWEAVRRRLTEAAQFHFDGLVEQIRQHVRLLGAAGWGGEALDMMAGAVEEFFFAARSLEEKLAQRFG